MRHVLVVDDDPVVGLALRAKLQEGQHYSVTVATNGMEALQLARSQRPDLVLCDIDMPDMDGVAVSEAMMADDATKKIPMIFLSALVTPSDVKRGVAAGNRPMLSKHSPLAEIRRAIDEATSSPS